MDIRARIRRLDAARLLWAVVIGIAAGAFVGAAYSLSPELYAADFTGIWRAARLLRAGADPYQLDVRGLPYPLGPLAYPLPAAVAALPLAQLPAWVAAGLFVAVGVGALAYTVLSGPPFRLLMLGTPCFVMAISLVQWSPLLTAAATISPLGAFAVCKPNLGLALLARRPSWWIVGGGALLLFASFAFVPAWLPEWTSSVSQMSYYKAPILVPGGILLALAVLRWRDPDARLLLALAVLPANLILYDQLPLFLVARSRRDAVMLFLGSWSATMASQAVVPKWITDEIVRQTYMRVPVVVFLFLPALFIVLARPTPSGAPDIVERMGSRLRQSWRRAATT